MQLLALWEGFGGDAEVEEERMRVFETRGGCEWVSRKEGQGLKSGFECSFIEGVDRDGLERKRSED